jgi:Uncharacterized protein containing SIS (Sugar ISomerase) phosphosugar binding domain
MTDLETFSAATTAHLARVIEVNARALADVAALVIDVAGRKGLLYTAGAGHSLSGVIETFFRAGGFAFVRPLWHPDLLPLRGAERSTAAERRPGLGREVVAASSLEARDAVVVFSNSGVNPYPIEVAQGAREGGARVVAISSRTASDAAPLRAGARLHEIADLVLDTMVPPGDATWPAAAPVTAPLSTLTNAMLWNAVLVLAHEADPDLPVWRSANVSDSGDGNDRIAEAFAPRVPEIRMGQIAVESS